MKSGSNRPGANRGEANFKSKLTEDEVVEIFLSAKKQSELAKKFGVSQSCINHIKRQQTWAWLTSRHMSAPEENSHE